MNSYEIFSSEEKLEVYSRDKKIGTARKVYESVWDKGEYRIAFANAEDMELFIIIGSILIILMEVVASESDLN